MPHRNTSNKLTCIESFCGAGGMSLGLKQAGFDVRLAFDINENAVETYNKNIGNHCEKLDASIVSGKFLLEKAGIKTRLDLFSGGPPCQGFSKQKRGAHLLDDDRNKLVLEYSRLVNELKPRAFLFENVEIFGQKRGKDLINEIKNKLIDYNIYTYFICSSDFGVAQKRGRFLMIGIDKSEGKVVPKLLKSDKTLTIRDVIGQLPPPPEDYKEHPDIPNHIKCKIKKINEERFSYVPPGGGWKDIPFNLRLKCHQKVDTASGGWPDVYGRLEWDKQCPTITAGFDSFTRGRYGHPSQNRAITLREGAMLQGFPVNYRFYGNRDAIRLQIGNAVPPPVSYAAGTAIINCLNTMQDKNHFNFQNPMELDKDGQFSLAI
ncbi:TPA: DNA cytosine methyltransferase [Escherichia coli]|jgi:DNA (cytosine-5)-methyltransferase 1|uniref:Cytosine-specific methyltransferase n=6 Tax=Escherichia coli TaxID=562 RepID=A0A7H9SIC4_ECOLX|nr:DNA cytosine methyltransferase [Escherichia coli]EBY5214774.1 DNA cytosine methyltransferase [Salmonella enterica subsp. enterica serovar Anatum]EFQ0452423.1 DNA cytosine methyltransferase [Shigella sonnei]EFF2333000.1 DNA cytosine methyltransferase [Escherichia coli]EFG8169856.1 DNA cytosine methyltransferase [Escherichia coli]EFH3516334.1 DNA (cytosine-5-)-methyltransferase [Escherichia coli]